MNPTDANHEPEELGGELKHYVKPAQQALRVRTLQSLPLPAPAARRSGCNRNATSASRTNCTCWPSSRSRRVPRRSWCAQALCTLPGAAQTEPGRERWLRFVWPSSSERLAPIFYIPMMLDGWDFRCDRGHISSWCDSRCLAIARNKPCSIPRGDRSKITALGR